MPATNPTSPSIRSTSVDCKRQRQKEAQPRTARSLAIRCVRQALIAKVPNRFISFAWSLLPTLTHSAPAEAAPEALVVEERAAAAVARAGLAAREAQVAAVEEPEEPVEREEPVPAEAAAELVAPGQVEPAAERAVARPAEAEAQAVVIVAATLPATTTT